jgi:uncharacterized protein YjbI with pentapeptide repeats
VKEPDDIGDKFQDNSVVKILSTSVPLASVVITAIIACVNIAIANKQDKNNVLIATKQYQEKTVYEYVEFVKDILFDVYYSDGKDPRIPAVSVSNFISSKTVTTLKILENSDKQKELIDFLKQAKIGFLPIYSEDDKSKDIPNTTKKVIENESDCPMDYKSETSHPRITNPCLLTGINLDTINLNKQDLSFVVLKRAKLRGTQLQETQLQKANFRKADLSQANLTEANLIEANLVDAKMIGANLSDADLRHADLKNADLRSIKVKNKEGQTIDISTNLTKAKLQGAILIGATLDGADLTDANLKDAKLDPQLTEEKALKLKGVTLCRTTLPNGKKIGSDCKL